ncbi:COG3628 Phage baseplate assembly protein W [uncultured Caudovirales phage]|uniref:COG3628 Phage baseplate assembly protein W n=1 Tax=uncultured Caudovirales phage TaxID=2100421 RepID=A0A6J7WJK9_9CAUD|nr:COG3628 Phage baseplate assembly protein W [uncultured Caudovirales phage]
MTIYRGFSTLQNKKKYVLTDYALARQDLINYFNIRKGDKLMQPNFGTIIWNHLFDPLDEAVQELITKDVMRIVGYDPRLRVGQVAITQEQNGLLIQITLSYIPTNQVDTINFNFNQNSKTLTLG